MRTTRATGLVGCCFLMLVACSGGDDDSEPTQAAADPGSAEAIQTQVADDPVQAAFVERNEEAASAVGGWSLSDDGSSFTASFTASEFTCDGPQSGEAVEFEIINVEGDTLILELEGERITWTRVSGDGGSSGLEGTWETRIEEDDEEPLLLTLGADGSVLVSSLPSRCEEDRPDGDVMTEDGCYLIDLPRNHTIMLDGSLDDWSGESISGGDDATDDSSASMSGDEIVETRVAADSDNLFIMLRLDERMNENFQRGGGELAGSYDIEIRHDAGKRGGTYFLTIVYDDASSRWTAMGQGGSVDVVAANQALEARVSWSTLGNPSTLYAIHTYARDCSQGPDCVVYDEGPCFAENVRDR